MYHPKNQSKHVTKIAYKLQAEVNEITAKLENLKAKYEKLQGEHTKICNANHEFKAERARIQPHYCELEDRLQEVINELSVCVVLKS